MGPMSIGSYRFLKVAWAVLSDEQMSSQDDHFPY